MDILKSIEFWKCNRAFLNKIGADTGQKKRENKLTLDDEKMYIEFMKIQGFDEYPKVEAEFHAMLARGIKRAKKRVENKIKELEKDKKERK